ncbi:MAG TPA: thioesterase family protein [Gemmatimonadales bacterium]
MSEAVPPAAFAMAITATEADMDELGHVNNVVYLSWIQDVAKAHWFAVSTPEETALQAWVAVRHEIEYKKPAIAGDRLVARTWIGTVSGVTSERFVEIRKHDTMELLVTCRTVWASINRQTGRPMRTDPALMERFRVTRS